MPVITIVLPKGTSALYEAVSLSEDDRLCLVERKPLGFGQQPMERPKQ